MNRKNIYSYTWCNNHDLNCINSVRHFFFLSIIAAVFLSSCRDKCENKSANSGFRVYQELEYYEESKKRIKEVEEDTFMIGTYITFEATGNADSYEWTIGQDSRVRTEKKFVLYFNPIDLRGTTQIKVQLKTKNNADAACFPNSENTIEQNITLLNNDFWPVIGQYYGSDDRTPDKKYTIEILRGDDPGFKGNIIQYIKNLPDGCSDTKYAGIGGAAFEFTIGQTRTTSNKYLDCYYYFMETDKRLGRLLSDRKTITIDYIYTKPSEDNKIQYHQIFTGKKVD